MSESGHPQKLSGLKPSQKLAAYSAEGGFSGLQGWAGGVYVVVKMRRAATWERPAEARAAFRTGHTSGHRQTRHDGSFVDHGHQ